MSVFSNSLATYEEEHYTLNFDQPEKNPGGMFVIRENKVKDETGKFLSDKIAIYKPLYDPRDRLSIKCQLQEDNSGITFFDTSVPTSELAGGVL